MNADQLRIALFSGNYNYVRDGANQAQNRLVGFLLSQGAQVRVYSPTTDTPAFEPTGDLVSVPAFSMVGGRSEYKIAKGLPSDIVADIDAFKPNLIHVSAPDILGHRAVTYAKKRNIGVVASVHTLFDTYLKYYGFGFAEPLMVAIMRRFYNRCDALVVPSEEMAQRLRDQGITTPSNIWSRGVNHDQFNPYHRSLEWRRSQGIQDDDILIGFIGRVVLEKGLDVFADVVKKLEANGVAHKVLVIGNGPAKQWFAEQVPEAVFTGYQTGENLGRAIASLDIFLQPSVTEAFGNVTLEAMAAGVPVVAARATGANILVNDPATGRLIEPRDIDGYVAAITEYSRDPELRKAAGQASYEAAKAYSWDAINAKVLDVYLDVMDKRLSPISAL